MLDVAALIAVLPRITTPTLTAHDVGQLDMVDLTAIGTDLPNRVEDAMADIAVVFHWPPQAMDGMELTELMAWRERARERCEAE